MNQKKNDTIRISDLIHALFKRKIMIIVLTFLGLLVGILLSIVSYLRGEMSKQYVISGSIAVISQTKDGLFTTQTTNPNSTDIYLAENMVDSVMFVLKSDKTLDAAVDRLNLIGISARDIYDNLELTQYNKTQIVEMSLYWRNADEGVSILEAINAVAPDILIETLKIGGLSVVNNPHATYRIGGSVNASLWVYMAAMGFMTGCGISILLLFLRPTLINSKDVRETLNMELLGEVSENKKYFSQRKSLLMEDRDNLGEEIREEYSSIAHILSNKLGKKKHQCIYVTSSDQNEGKTNVAANLAVQLANQENKILLVDFDIRNPSLGNMFLERVDYRHSLNSLYHGDTEVEDAIVSLTGYLDLLPAVLEQKELPLGDAMRGLIKELSMKYDYVLMDTAPVGRVANIMSLNRISSTVLFVVQYDTVSMKAIRESLERLEKSGMGIIGCVVNRSKSLDRVKYKYYYSKYGKNRKYGNYLEDHGATEYVEVAALEPPKSLSEQMKEAEQMDVPEVEDIIREVHTRGIGLQVPAQSDTSRDYNREFEQESDELGQK